MSDVLFRRGLTTSSLSFVLTLFQQDSLVKSSCCGGTENIRYLLHVVLLSNSKKYGVDVIWMLIPSHFSRVDRLLYGDKHRKKHVF